MALCDKCLFYSKEYDELNQDWNDIGNLKSHFCPMYENGIPLDITYEDADCKYFEPKEGSNNNVQTQTHQVR